VKVYHFLKITGDVLSEAEKVVVRSHHRAHNNERATVQSDESRTLIENGQLDFISYFELLF